jgi:hypothetical protein
MPAVAELVAAPSTISTFRIATDRPVQTWKATLTNRSSYILTLVGYEGAGERDELPSAGTLLFPDEHVHFEITPTLLGHRTVVARFDVIQPHGNVLGTEYRIAVTAKGIRGSERGAFAPELLTQALSSSHLVVADV